jgi:peptidoglycan/LPS O-acetylase OafA/YrhL
MTTTPASHMKRTESAAQSLKLPSKYRADIDGLRAVAVMLVVLFHLKFRLVKGGFIGVDIFFVISGYLITQHVYQEVSAGKFSITSFYERRIRRIFPAMAGMLIATSVVAYILLLPKELVDYAKSLVAAVLSYSNFYFWVSSNYFSGGDKPLLHTWSLAVEEQFYLVLPPLLLLLRNASVRIRTVAIISISVASFVLSTVLIFRYPEATFYLLPTRAWELLLGGMLGMGIIGFPQSRWTRQLFGISGLVLIAASAFLYTTKMPFPGPLALVPCVGALLIIGAGGQQGTATDRFLSLKPMVFIGLISYSLYLWHVPIIYFQQCTTALVFGRILPKLLPFLTPNQAVTGERYILLLSASIGAGFLSWKFIEQPFRYGSFKPSRSKLFGITAACASALVLAGVIIVAKEGVASRFPPEIVRIASYTQHSDYRLGTCLIVNHVQQFDREHCLTQEAGRQNWLLIGDSHAGMLAEGISKVRPDLNLSQATETGCLPMLQPKFGEDRYCTALMHYIFYDYIESHKPDVLMIAANWQPSDLPRLDRTMQFLKGRVPRIILVGPVMQYDTPLPRLLATAVQDHNPSLAASHRIQSLDALDSRMRQLAEQTWKVNYISYPQLLCPKGNCLLWSAPDVPLQADTSHFTIPGSILAVQRMNEAGELGPR